MRISTKHKGDITILSLARDFDGGKDCEKFQETISGLIAEGERKFVLNFSMIRWINSCGLGKLVSIHQEVGDSGGRVILCNLEGRNLSIMYTTKLYDVFEVSESLNEALARFETVETGS